jgi:hypothetical protein
MKSISWQSISFANVLRMFFTIALVSFWTACADDSQNLVGPDADAASAKPGGSGTVGGNDVCTAGEFSTGRINYDAATGNWYLAGQSYANGNTPFDFGEVGFKIVVSADGKSFTWTADPGICVKQVIIKGADSSTKYSYTNGETTGTGLTAPYKGKNIPQISNATICYDKCGVVCYDYDTAFGGDTQQGGAAWWFSFDPTLGGTQTIYAGQNATDGTVTLDGGVFTINLGTTYMLSGVAESVKIGGYNTLPATRPAAGKFELSGGTTLYKGTSLSVGPVASYPYYVIHLDVKKEVACPL